MQSLEQEMADAYSDSPSLAVALLELTRDIGKEAWCQSFEWRAGSLTIQIKEGAEEDVDLVRTLEFSPVLGDVVQISKAVGPRGDVVRRFQMNARYDMAGEKHGARPPKKNAAKDQPPEDVKNTAGNAGNDVSDQPVKKNTPAVVPPPPPPPAPVGGPGR
jgi:hypothetical protein